MPWRVNRLEDLPPEIRSKAGSSRGARGPGRSPDGKSPNGVGSWVCVQCGFEVREEPWRVMEQHLDRHGHHRADLTLGGAL